MNTILTQLVPNIFSTYFYDSKVVQTLYPISHKLNVVTYVFIFLLQHILNLLSCVHKKIYFTFKLNFGQIIFLVYFILLAPKKLSSLVKFFKIFFTLCFIFCCFSCICSLPSFCCCLLLILHGSRLPFTFRFYCLILAFCHSSPCVVNVRFSSCVAPIYSSPCIATACSSPYITACLTLLLFIICFTLLLFTIHLALLLLVPHPILISPSLVLLLFAPCLTFLLFILALHCYYSFLDLH